MLSLFHSSLLDWQVGALTTPVDPWNSARQTWKSEARAHFTSVIVPVVLICQTCPGRLKYRFLDLWILLLRQFVHELAICAVRICPLQLWCSWCTCRFHFPSGCSQCVWARYGWGLLHGSSCSGIFKITSPEESRRVCGWKRWRKL